MLLFFWEIKSRKKYSAQHFPISGSVSVYELIYVVAGRFRACVSRVTGGRCLSFFGRDDVHRWGFFFCDANLHIYPPPLHHYYTHFHLLLSQMQTQNVRLLFSFITSAAILVRKDLSTFCPRGLQSNPPAITRRNMFQIYLVHQGYTVHLNLFFFLFSFLRDFWI